MIVMDFLSPLGKGPAPLDPRQRVANSHHPDHSAGRAPHETRSLLEWFGRDVAPDSITENPASKDDTHV